MADEIERAFIALEDACCAASAAMDKFAARWRNLRSDPSIAADLDEWEAEFP